MKEPHPAVRGGVLSLLAQQGIYRSKLLLQFQLLGFKLVCQVACLSSCLCLCLGLLLNCGEIVALATFPRPTTHYLSARLADFFSRTGRGLG